jgi:hypothetical protein
MQNLYVYIVMIFVDAECHIPSSSFKQQAKYRFQTAIMLF